MIEVIAPWYQWERQNKSPLDRLEQQLRPVSLQVIYWFGYHLRWMFLTSLVVWLATSPLVMQRFHLVSPIAVLLGPLLAVPIMIAMIAGMSLVLLSFIPVLSTSLAFLTAGSLQVCDYLVTTLKQIPFGFGYWPDVPDWWVQCFYAGLLAVLLMPAWRLHWKRWTFLAVGWLLLILVITRPDVPAGLRMTVLSVGHGTAIVLELPNGKCLVYDAGSLSGPEVSFRHLSNYLWYRRRMKIDDVLISHADLDHFNGLPDLMERFRMGSVRLTPTFSQKPDRGTQATLAYLANKQIPRSILRRGDILEEGDVEIEVLHPPQQGPDGTENARSLVLLITCEGRRILLTGDLEQPGMEQVMRIPIMPVDVMVAPHHGSSVSNTERFAAWCQPGLVISSETIPRGPKPDPYTPRGAKLWRTWIHGGVTVEIDAQGVKARTTFSGQEWRR